jgi:hypothetical protein
MKSKQLEMFKKKFIVETHEIVKYKFEVEAEDYYNARDVAKKMINNWQGSNTEYIVYREWRGGTEITGEDGIRCLVSDLGSV